MMKKGEKVIDKATGQSREIIKTDEEVAAEEAAAEAAKDSKKDDGGNSAGA